MSILKNTILLMLVAASAIVSAEQVSAADGYSASPRQYYSEWRKHPSHDYHYRSYYYKPSTSYSGYKHHYVVYSPKKPEYCYFYNPYKKQYWGRCYSSYGKNSYAGQPLYSHLKPEHRLQNLSQIPEAHFPEFAGPPIIPDSEDGILLELPPDDLPGAF